MADLSDDELMIMYCDGDLDAFDVLVDRYAASVYNFACSMLNDAGRAEDILQDTLLAVARSAKHYQPRGLFRTWIMRIVRNRCLNAIETERLRRIAIIESQLAVYNKPSSDCPPDERLDADETLTTVKSAIDTLPHQQREAILLFAYEQMTYKQIGQVLDVPVNTIKTLIHRARAELSLRLDGREKENTDDV